MNVLLAWTIAVGVPFAFASEPKASMEVSTHIPLVPKDVVSIDVRLLQIDPALVTVHVAGYSRAGRTPGAAQNLATSKIELRLRNPFAKSEGETPEEGVFGAAEPRAGNQFGFDSALLSGPAVLQIGDREVPVESMGAEPFKDVVGLSSAVKLSAAPQLITFVGSEASINMGTQLPYLEPDESGCLQLKWTDEFAEGITIEALADAADEASVHFKSINVKVHRLRGRKKLDDIPFDVGKPSVFTFGASMEIEIAKDATILLALPRMDDDMPLVLALVRAQRAVIEVEKDSANAKDSAQPPQTVGDHK